MSSINDHTDQLIQGYCNGSLSDIELAELGRLIKSDESVLIRYLDSLNLCNELLYSFADRDLSKLAHMIDRDGTVDLPQAADLREAERQHNAAPSAAPRFVSKRNVLILAVAATFAFFTANLFLRTHVDLPDSAEVEHKNHEITKPPSLVEEEFVARVVYEGPDATWVNGLTPGDFLLRIRRNECIAISAGVVEIVFNDGTSVILQGPSELVPLGPNSAKLVSGRLTGRANDSDGFHLEAGAAKVVDLGTEFGVSLVDEFSADVCVFDGVVEVRALNLGGDIDEPVRLTEGMALRVGGSGDADIDRDMFVRREALRSRSTNQLQQLALVDILSLSDQAGDNPNFAGAIDPLTGTWDLGNPDYRNDGRKALVKGDGLFHPCAFSSLIDGTIAPTSKSGTVQIDSGGSTAELGKTNGHFYGPIWSRRKASFDRHSNFNADFWGTGTLKRILSRLDDSNIGIVGIHPNAGITLNLASVQEAYGKSLAGMRSILTNLGVHPKLRRQSADLCIYIDGQLRYERRDFAQLDGEALIDIALAPEDKFLTVLSTDAGDQTLYDHVVLVDAVFVFE